MPQPRAKQQPKVEVILDQQDAKKGSVKFYTDERPVAVTNIYLGKGYLKDLGNPGKLKITIEAYQS